jgi:hypothetical protein
MSNQNNKIYDRIHRAQVVNNKDPLKTGQVMLYIPVIMPEIPKSKGLWARPANNPVGGRNMEGESDHHYMGSSYIPKKGSWVFCFFEDGNPNRPYYFGALDLENTKVLPENQVGANYENKWTILKSHSGRVIHVSDDTDDERIEIGGKKRQLSSPPTGDLDSVYTIDENMTTILFDERTGKEKILIRTYKGDFFHIDIDERKLQIEFENDIIIKSNGNIHIHAGDNIEVKADSNIKLDAGNEFDQKSGGTFKNSSGGDYHINAGGTINTDGSERYDQTGNSVPANSANPEDPEGERDT